MYSQVHDVCLVVDSSILLTLLLIYPFTYICPAFPIIDPSHCLDFSISPIFIESFLKLVSTTTKAKSYSSEIVGCGPSLTTKMDSPGDKNWVRHEPSYRLWLTMANIGQVLSA